MPELVVVRGLPGSGKSTWAKAQFRDTHLIYEPDLLVTDANGKYRFDSQLWPEVHTLIEHLADHALQRGEDVCIVEVLPTRHSVHHLNDLASFHRASFRVFCCQNTFTNVHHVPLYIWQKFATEFQQYPNEKYIVSDPTPEEMA